MSQSDNPNAPLPRMEKDAAVKWAENYTAYMARLTDVELTPSTAKVNFEACIGENDEVAEDGRYSLFYYVYSPAPVTEHTRVVRTLRRELSEQGYEVTGYREFQDAYSSAIFSARNKKNSYRIKADTVGSGKKEPQALSFSVRTPCMLPPGAEQQQF
ncbi:hypothetical protein [Streptomyces acidicola]|uniref:Uncharacterized protein n=1 Tax=Streptomyces acidicola TaxID=2596892 RepID=A0A5N8WNK4_9ACTN|nr:hypothetical protein [Streptomyces acidicola]MPY49020.1 hypothetical protein [Streptomyces acidicola]